MKFTFRFFAVPCTVLFVGVGFNSQALAHAYAGTSATEPSTTDSNRLAQNFVIPLYVKVLGTQPDPGGLYLRVNFLRGNCNADGFNEVARPFFYSFRLERPTSLTEQVALLYHTLLGRNPDSDGLAAWTNFFRQARLSIALQGFIPSQEFRSLLPDRTDRGRVTALVSRLYQQVLGRNADSRELAGWVDFIVATRDLEAAARAFLTSPEFESRALTVHDYVTILYRVFLARDPDPTGQGGWELFMLNTLLQVINTGFISSTEFESRIPELCAALPSITVSVSPASAILQPGATQQFSATISGTSNTEVVWYVNWLPGGNSVIGTITPNGLYTAPATTPYPGVVSIIATSGADSTIPGIATVYLSGPILVRPP